MAAEETERSLSTHVNIVKLSFKSFPPNIIDIPCASVSRISASVCVCVCVFSCSAVNSSFNNSALIQIILGLTTSKQKSVHHLVNGGPSSSRVCLQEEADPRSAFRGVRWVAVSRCRDEQRNARVAAKAERS